MSGPPVDPQLLKRLDDLTAALESATQALNQLSPNPLSLPYVPYAEAANAAQLLAGLETHGKQERERGGS